MGCGKPLHERQEKVLVAVGGVRVVEVARDVFRETQVEERIFRHGVLLGVDRPEKGSHALLRRFERKVVQQVDVCGHVPLHVLFAHSEYGLLAGFAFPGQICVPIVRREIVQYLGLVRIDRRDAHLRERPGFRLRGGLLRAPAPAGSEDEGDNGYECNPSHQRGKVSQKSLDL